MKKWEPNPEELEKNQKRRNEKMGPTFGEVDKKQKITNCKSARGPGQQPRRQASNTGRQ